MADADDCVGGRTVPLDQGDVLFADGDIAHSRYRVASGVLTLSRSGPDGRRQVVGFAFPGEFVGSAQAGRYSYTAVAAGGSVVRASATPGAGPADAEAPSAGATCGLLAGHEFDRARDQLALLGCAVAARRLAHFLLMLDERMPVAGRGRDIVPLPMPRRDIADYLGMTVEAVSRAFAQLTGCGAIVMTADGTRLSDRDRLAGDWRQPRV